MEINIIHNPAEYDAAMCRVRELMGLERSLSPVERDELDLLFLVVAHYEKQHAAPPVLLDPVDYLEFLLDQETITRKDLVPLLGSVPRVSEVLSRRRPLSLAMIRRLHDALNIPADVLLRPIADCAQSPRKSKPVRAGRAAQSASLPAFA